MIKEEFDSLKLGDVAYRASVSGLFQMTVTEYPVVGKDEEGGLHFKDHPARGYRYHYYYLTALEAQKVVVEDAIENRRLEIATIEESIGSLQESRVELMEAIQELTKLKESLT